MRSQVEEKFTLFYETWISQLEDLLRDHEVHEATVDKLTAHHKEYYAVKWASAKEDVLAFFTAVWLSPFESAHQWVTGWKPSMAFRLMEKLQRAKPSESSMNEEQSKKLEALRSKIRAEEERVERDMERQQVAMADRNTVELARRSQSSSEVRDGRFGDGSPGRLSGSVEVALKGLLAGLERVMKMADCVRLKTLKGVLDVLTPEQGVEFLAATSNLQIQMRKWGKTKRSDQQ